MPLAKVLARGQVTLPRSVRRAARIQPGDLLIVRLTAPATVEMKALPRLRLADALERFRVEGPVDDRADRARWETRAAEEVLGGKRG